MKKDIILHWRERKKEELLKLDEFIYCLKNSNKVYYYCKDMPIDWNNIECIASIPEAEEINHKNKSTLGWLWVLKLISHPIPIRLAGLCPWEELDNDDWGELLINQPEFINYCHTKFTDSEILRITRHQPKLKEELLSKMEKEYD